MKSTPMMRQGIEEKQEEIMRSLFKTEAVLFVFLKPNRCIVHTTGVEHI